MSFFHSLFRQSFFKDIRPKFTYIGIGSCPHISSLNEYTPKQNQLIPVFVRDLFETYEYHPEWTIRMLHFDPLFEQKLEFLQAYFEQEGLIYSLVDGQFHLWSAPGIQVILVSQKILDAQDPYTSAEANDWGIESILQECMAENRKVALQSFTGSNTLSWFRKLYEQSGHSDAFRRNILFDVTYENDTGCGSDMSVYKPYYDSDGNFLNILLYSNDELLNNLFDHPEIAARARRIYYAKFRTILNTKHVDYRRLVQKMTEFSIPYSTPEEAMADIYREITDLLTPLLTLGLIDGSRASQMLILLKEYKSHDMYKWYDKVINMVKLDEPTSNVSQPS